MPIQMVDIGEQSLFIELKITHDDVFQAFALIARPTKLLSYGLLNTSRHLVESGLCNGEGIHGPVAFIE